MFKTINCKLGNMRKAADWTIYPHKSNAIETIIIQCSNRIASVDLNTAKAVLSSGKGGHQGFMALNPLMGSTTVDVPSEVIAKLRELTNKTS